MLKKPASLLILFILLPVGVSAQDREFKRYFAIEEEINFEVKTYLEVFAASVLGALKTSGDKKVWILNSENRSVDVYSPQGQLLHSTYLKKPDSLNRGRYTGLRPVDLTFGPQGAVWGMYYGRGASLGKFDGNGKLQDYFFIPRRPRGWREKLKALFLPRKERHWFPSVDYGNSIMASKNGSLYLSGIKYIGDGKGQIVESEYTMIHNFDSTGKWIRSFLKLPESFTKQFNNYAVEPATLTRIELGQNENLWATVWGLPTVYKYSLQGEALDSFRLQIPDYRPIKPYLKEGEINMDSVTAWMFSWMQILGCYPILDSLLLIQYNDLPDHPYMLQLYDRKGKLLVSKMTAGQEIIQVEPDGSVYYLVPQKSGRGLARFTLVKRKFSWPGDRK